MLLDLSVRRGAHDDATTVRSDPTFDLLVVNMSGVSVSAWYPAGVMRLKVANFFAFAKTWGKNGL